MLSTIKNSGVTEQKITTTAKQYRNDGLFTGTAKITAFHSFPFGRSSMALNSATIDTAEMKNLFR